MELLSEYLFYANSKSLEQCRLFSSIEESAPFIYTLPFLSLHCSPGAVNLKQCHQESAECSQEGEKVFAEKAFQAQDFCSKGCSVGFCPFGHLAHVSLSEGQAQHTWIPGVFVLAELMERSSCCQCPVPSCRELHTAVDERIPVKQN